MRPLGSKKIKMAATTDNAPSVGAGVACALSGNLLISLSFQMQRLVHVSGDGTVSYLWSPLWWLGISCMAAGEIGNLVAYGMAPASLVAPLGAVAVISNACLSRLFLKEIMSYRCMFGVLCALAGAFLVVVNAPRATNRVSMYDGVASVGGLVSGLVVAVAVLFIANPLKWRIGVSAEYASKRVVCYCGLCSLLGGVTVTGAKYVSTAVSQALAGNGSMWNDRGTCWLTYVLVVGVAGAAVLQVMYLNEALRNFGASLVVPVYYIMFTSVSIGAGMVLFDETAFDPKVLATVLFVCGILLAFSGVFIINNQRVDHSSFDGGARLKALFATLEVRNCLALSNVVRPVA